MVTKHKFRHDREYRYQFPSIAGDNAKQIWDSKLQACRQVICPARIKDRCHLLQEDAIEASIRCGDPFREEEYYDGPL